MLKKVADEDKKKNSFTCLLCGQELLTDAALRNHKYESHDGTVKRIHPLDCCWCPKQFQTRRGLANHLVSCVAVTKLLFPSHCPACKVEIKEAADLPVHCLKCTKWSEDVASQQADLDEFDAQLINSTRHMATARFTKDLLEEVEIRLAGGGRMFGFVLPGGVKRLGPGTEAFVRPLKRRQVEVVDEDLKLVLKTHVFCSLVDIEKYRFLEDDDPLCCMPFSTYGKELARRLAGLLVQSGADVFLCLKVEVYGRRKSEDPHSLDLAIPDVRSFKVVNEEHDSTRQVMIGTARWNALVTLATTRHFTLTQPHMFGC